MHNALDMHSASDAHYGMTLSEYMQSAKLDDQQIAEKVKRDRTSVARWRLGRTKPDFEALVAIEKMTNGLVTARDFAVSVQAAE